MYFEHYLFTVNSNTESASIDIQAARAVALYCQCIGECPKCSQAWAAINLQSQHERAKEAAKK